MKFKVNNNSQDERLSIVLDAQEASEGVFIVTKHPHGMLQANNLKINPDCTFHPSSIGYGGYKLTFTFKINDQDLMEVIDEH